ncbi:hypothetical protein DMC47_10465 [Nostoc sp. 3335mG]|nr:hypothetical protein DMC47_10465 [Nostoc sp. 3335mG]
MDVTVIFDPTYDGEATGAVWIVESSMNRLWFDRSRKHLDDSSAVFSVGGGAITDGVIQRVIWNLDDHYPAWRRIDLIGAPEVSGELADLAAEGLTVTGIDGRSTISRC